MKKNECHILTIEDITKEGFGIGKVNGFTLFVNGALPGDEVKIKTIKINKSFGYGKLLETIKSTSHRVEPKCREFFKCGGCTLQNLEYTEQLRIKKKIVYDALTRVGKLQNIEVQDVIGMKEPYFYRNKAQFPVREREEGGAVLGFFAPRTHKVIPVSKCYIQHEITESILEIVQLYINKFNITPYNEEKNSGVLRNVFVRTGTTSGDIMICFVINQDVLPHQEYIIKKLTDNIKNVKSILINVNKDSTNVILGKTTRAIFGENFIYDYIDNIKFKISAKSFYQVNPVQTEILYNTALKIANLSKNDRCLDLYCGIGTISLFLAKKAKVREVVGIETVKEAVEDARENANINNITNVNFVEGKAEELTSDSNFDVIVIDPPRKGCDVTLLETILQIKPEKVIYISCDPGTLARDLKILCNSEDYAVKVVQPLDMFPHTMHMECVCLLTRTGG